MTYNEARAVLELMGHKVESWSHINGGRLWYYEDVMNAEARLLFNCPGRFTQEKAKELFLAWAKKYLGAE